MAYRTHPNRKRNSTIYTPPNVALALHRIVTQNDTLYYPTVLDPSIGDGDLVRPFRQTSQIIGCDLKIKPAIADKFRKADFTSIKKWNVQPDLIMCNPPFNGGDRRMMWPERFLRSIFRIFGPSVPTLIIVPMGFRFNQRWISKRRKWLRHECPPITSIVSLPLDAFPGAQVFSEVLIFNIPALQPHYVI